MKRKTKAQSLEEHNKLLALLNKEKTPTVAEVRRAIKVPVSTLNVMTKKLKNAGRVNEARRVVNKTPLTLKEFNELEYPYPTPATKKKLKEQKEKKRARDREYKRRKKELARARKNGAPEALLPEPIEVSAGPASGACITVSISVEAITELIQALREGRL